MLIRFLAIVAGLAALVPIAVEADETDVSGWEEITTGTRLKARGHSPQLVYLGVLSPGQCKRIDPSICDQRPNTRSSALQRSCRRLVVMHNQMCSSLQKQKELQRYRYGRGLEITL